MNPLGIRTKVAGLAAVATACLLSLVGTIGYLALVEATSESQSQLLNQRLDQFELQLQAGDTQAVVERQIDSSVRVVLVGQPLPPPIENTLRVIRFSPDPEIRAIVGIVDTGRINATLATIRRALWLSVAVLGLIVGLTAWVVVDRALSPVRKLTKEARANIQTRSLELVESPASRDEISALADTFNSMLTGLREADMERRRFVSDASHELRTPLMVMGAEAEYALENPGGSTQPRVTEFAEVVQTQTDRLAGLVDDLLSLATLDEAQSPVSKLASVSQVLTEADALILVDDLPAEIAETMIPNVCKSLANIVANARRYQSETVALGVVANRTSVQFTIDDDGPGVPPSERGNIFKRFYRPDEDRGRHQGGAGLGLAIAKAELDRVNGSVEVTDSPLGGARFVLTAPTAARVSAPPPTRPATSQR